MIIFWTHFVICRSQFHPMTISVGHHSCPIPYVSRFLPHFVHPIVHITSTQHLHKHLDRRHRAMSTSSPQRRPTAAEMYFYTEVCSSLDDVVAQNLLSAKSVYCAGSDTPTAGLPTEGRKNHPLRKSSSIQGCWSQSQVSKMYFYTELRSSLGHMAAEHWLSGTSVSCAVSNTSTHQLKSSSSNQDSWSVSQASTPISAAVADTPPWSQHQASTPIPAADTASSLSSSFSSQCLASERLSSGAWNKCQMLKSRIMSISFLVRKHGEKAGLLFTDAAHELLDDSSPIISRGSSVVSRCCSSTLADPKVSAVADGGRRRRRSSFCSSHCSHSSKYESDPSRSSLLTSSRLDRIECSLLAVVGLIVLSVVSLLLIISLITESA
jgi:hypothetical protein